LLGYGTALDVAFTLGIAALFFGTLTGLLIATISGLLMALYITAARAVLGYDRAVGWYLDGLRPRIIWTHQPPSWKPKARPAPPAPPKPANAADTSATPADPAQIRPA
jgi:hypothetical protein